MLQKEDIQQIRTVVKEEFTTAIEVRDVQQIRTVVKEEVSLAIQANNKNLVTNGEFTDLLLMLKNSFDHIEKRFQRIEERLQRIEERLKNMDYEISLRPTLEKIMTWSDRRIHSLEMSMQSAQYILRDRWRDLPAQREVHKTLVDDGIIG